MNSVLAKLRALFRRRRLERDMTEEMRFHVESRAADNLDRGLAPEAARRAAERRFGNEVALREIAREQRSFVWLEQTWHDVRYATRQLIRTPGFTLVAILSLAIGIGANTAMFSFLNAVWLRSLPVRNPRELVQLTWRVDAAGKGASNDVDVWGAPGFSDPSGRLVGAQTFSILEFQAFARAAQDTAEVFGFGGFGLPYAVVDGQPEDIEWEFVTGGIHAALGLRPAVGRLLTPADDRPGADAVAVISHRYWQKRFGGNPSVVGKQVVLQNVPLTIVGVLPREYLGLRFGETDDFAIPLTMIHRIQSSMAAQLLRDPGATSWLILMARPKPGVTAAALFDQLQGAYHAIVRERRPQTRDRAAPELPQLAFLPGHQGLSDGRKGGAATVGVLIGLAALLLLIACVNIANLMLARGSLRARELAVRLALGAGRGRIVRQLLAESALLAIVGGLAGLVLAGWGRDVLVAVNPMGGDQALPPVTLDLSVGAFVVAISALACIGSGLWPAFRATRFDSRSGFQGGLPSLGSGGRSTQRMAGGLIVAQVALSLTLLVAAGLLMQTVRNVRAQDVGFSRGGRLVFNLRAKPPGYPMAQFAPMLETIAEQLAARPGVRSATFSRLQVLNWGNTPREIFLADEATPRPEDERRVGTNDVAENFFASYEMPIVLGRGFDARDRAGSPKVAVVNQAFVRKFFGRTDPLGRRLGRTAATAAEIEIIGVVADARVVEPRSAPQPMLYTLFRQQTNTRINFGVRTVGDPRGLLPVVQQIVRGVAPDVLVAQVDTEEEIMNSFVARERLMGGAAAAFGVVAVPLVCIGLFGLVSFSVVRRTREIGIRMALGALPRGVLALLVFQFMRLVALGVAAGVALSWAATRVLHSFLFGISATDVTTYGVVALLLAGVTAIACWLPARRAARVDPLVALRAE